MSEWVSKIWTWELEWSKFEFQILRYSQRKISNRLLSLFYKLLDSTRSYYSSFRLSRFESLTCHFCFVMSEKKTDEIFWNTSINCEINSDKCCTIFSYKYSFLKCSKKKVPIVTHTATEEENDFDKLKTFFRPIVPNTKYTALLKIQGKKF